MAGERSGGLGREAEPVVSTAPPRHPLGWYGTVAGVEVEFLRQGFEVEHPHRAIVGQRRFDYAVARRADLPAGVEEMTTRRPLAEGEVAVPRSAIEGLSLWRLTAHLDGDYHAAAAPPDARGRMTLTAQEQPNERWGGNARDGWYAMVDSAGLFVVSTRHPVDPEEARREGLRWREMPADEAGDLIDFWAEAPWSMTIPDVHRRAVRDLGWSLERDENGIHLMNRVSNFTFADVALDTAPDGRVRSLSWSVSDRLPQTANGIRVPVPGVDVERSYRRLIEEGGARWGTPQTRYGGPRREESWLRPDGARIVCRRFPDRLGVRFEAPTEA